MELGEGVYLLAVLVLGSNLAQMLLLLNPPF